jgi:hypothetical protein
MVYMYAKYVKEQDIMIRLHYDKLDHYQYKILRQNLINAKTKGIAKLEKIALKQYCDYLDSLGYTLPKPRYKYSENDKTTWRYLPSYFRQDHDGHIKVVEIVNYDFRGN